MSYLNFGLVDDSFNITNFTYPFRAGVNGYIDSVGSSAGDKFPETYIGKVVGEQEIPFNTWANGTAIPTGKYRLFGAALSYPKDIVSSQPADLDTYLSLPFQYNAVSTPREYRPSGIMVHASILGYNTFSQTITSPHDTLYIYLTFQAPYGIHTGEVASIVLPKELTGFPGPFKVQTRSGYDIGQVEINPDTNELQVHFFADVRAINVQGHVGIFARFKSPESFSTGRYFFKFTNLGIDRYQYLNFKRPDNTVPRVSCRNDGTNGWIDVDVPHNYGQWSHANITASTSSGALIDKSKIKVVESTSVDIFGNITSFSEVSEKSFSSQQDGNSISIELQNPAPELDTMVRTSFPLFYGNLGKASGAVTKVQLFSDEKDTTYNLDCRFDSSGLATNSFSFEGIPLFAY